MLVFSLLVTNLVDYVDSIDYSNDTNTHRLIFEANVGQTVNLHCNVLANPSKSVHYSWFSALGERNLTSWIQRDAALDDQIDESR